MEVVLDGESQRCGDFYHHRSAERQSLRMHSHHSHSGAFCSHAAAGTSPWSMLEQAYKKGFTHYALTEHVPRQHTHELYPEEVEKGIGPSDLAATFERYISEARKASRYWSGVEIKDDSNDGQGPAPGRMHVLVGAETENIDVRSSDSLDFLSDTLGLEQEEQPKVKVDFVVGSVHHVYGVPIDFDKATFEGAMRHVSKEAGSHSPEKANTAADQQRSHLLLISAYLDAQHALIDRIRPEVIGHFDLCRLFMKETPMTLAGIARLLDHPDGRSLLAEVDAKVRRNISLAISYGALFEINAASVRKGWKTPYPAEDILDIILEHNGKLCLSDDAHSHEQVGLNYHVALQYLARKNVEHVWVLTRAGDASSADTVSQPFPRGTVAHRVPLSEFAHFATQS